jgi:hypothetical protein
LSTKLGEVSGVGTWDEGKTDGAGGDGLLWTESESESNVIVKRLIENCQDLTLKKPSEDQILILQGIQKLKSREGRNLTAPSVS